jgi:cytochrome c biogenesis protein CcdA
MHLLLTILVTLILPLLWNFLTVIYLTQNARKGRLSPLKFALAFSLGLSITISTILIVTITVTNGMIRIRDIGFVVLVFFLNFLIGFTMVYYLSKYLLEKYFVKWSSQSKRLKD